MSSRTLSLVPHREHGPSPRFVTLPLSLYVHVPWCVRKCPYCDFNSHSLSAPLDEKAFADALLDDLDLALPLVWGRQIKTIFFGGGTPSLLSADTVDHLISGLRARLPLQPAAEVTLEANPGTAEAGKFAAFRQAGVNRLSIGIQSFSETQLQALGRIHGAREALDAAETARSCFDNFNLDLMYGLPGQSLDEAMSDIEFALRCEPTHLSCYQLTVEPNTLFARHPPPDLPNPDVSADMQEAIERRLAAADFEHYETSAFARPGRACLHNVNYWQFGDYLGIGPGAHSKLTLEDRVLRQMRWKHPESWRSNLAKGVPCQQEVVVEAEELPFEFMMNALRLIEGFDTRLFSLRTGLPLSAVQRELDEAVAEGLLTLTDGRLAPTQQGQRFLNVLLQRFLPETGG